MDKTAPTQLEQPKVYTAPDTQVKPSKKWFQTWRVIYPLLGIVLLVELIFGLKTLLTPLPKAQYQSLRPITGAKILLISPKTEFKVGEQIPIKIRVSTGGHTTSGTDLVLQYDPKVLQTNQAAIDKGNIYNDYPIINVDTNTGIIRVSGVTSVGKSGFNGGGDLVTINFTGKSVGTSTLTIDFKPGVLNDSNVIKARDSIDVLEAVERLKLTIK